MVEAGDESLLEVVQLVILVTPNLVRSVQGFRYGSSAVLYCNVRPVYYYTG